MADLGALVESIARLGQLQPIVVTPNLDLIAGARRLAALTQLGRRKVLIHMVDELEDAGRALMAERDENSCRAPLRPSEAVALAKALEKLERTQARERQAQAGPRTGRGKKASGSGKLPEPVKGETREKVAKLVGMKPTTLGKAKKVVEAAECEPEKYQSVCDEMDETGNVDRAHKAVTNKSKLGTTKEKAPVTLPRQPEDIVEILWQERSREICVQVHRLLGARLQCQSNATEPTSTPAPMAGLPGSAG
jgi:ParB-like chromosome segregation protein Spo0J